jgi:LmbE family N-acetylglucosaminyl deacetylase
MTAERMLLTVAHPDDETFGCGSLLAHAADRGVEVTVVCATRGEAGEVAPGCDVPDGDLGAVREVELRAAADHLGVSEVVLLHWRDSGMDGEPAPGTFCGAPLGEVADALVPIIERLEPTVVVTLDATDGHRDHVHMRDATLAAVDRAGGPPRRVYLSCLPRPIMQGWMESLRERDPDSDYLHIGELGTPEDDIHVVIDTADLLTRREQAMALHRSQAPPHDVLPPDLRRRSLTAECLQQVRPPWDGGPVVTELFSPRAAPADPTPG